MDCTCKNCKKYSRDELLDQKICEVAGCSNTFHPTIFNSNRKLCDLHIGSADSIDFEGPKPDSEYGGLPVIDPRYPPKQCQDCGTWFQPSKFTWNYAKRCEECRKPKGNQSKPGSKTKMVPCAECNTMIEVGIFAANTQYCDNCRQEKGITKKGNPKPQPKKDYYTELPETKINRFISDVNDIKSKMLSIKYNKNNDCETKLFYAAIGQIETERLVFSGRVEERKDFVKEDIFLYLIPRGFKVAKNILYKRYNNFEYIALIFVRDHLHHVTYKFEKPNREESKMIITKDAYSKLSDQIKDDIDLIITITGVLKEDTPLTDDYVEMIRKQQSSYSRFADMDV